MDSSKKETKKQLTQKLLEFKLQGLISYQAYIEKEYANSIDKPNKAMYFKYISKEKDRCQRKIEKMKAKLGQSA